MSVAKQKLVEIPPEELDSLLCNFYITTKKKDNCLTQCPPSHKVYSDSVLDDNNAKLNIPKDEGIQGIERSPEIQTPGTQEAG